MNIETQNLRQVAYGLQTRMCYLNLPVTCQKNHEIILNRLSSLSSFFQESASLWENNEHFQFTKGKVSTTYSKNLNGMSQLLRKSVKSSLYGSISYHYGTISSKNLPISVSIHALNVKATGKVEAQLWKNKVFDPSLQLNATVDASLLEGNASLKIGNSSIYAKGSAKGYVGVAYAKTKAIVSVDEQTFSLGAGIAALKGSVSCSFHVFGASITLTGSGSIGSMEADLEYSHKNREWEFGSKLGFICGLGFKVKVNV
ncbi:MAG: hypothetical protein ACI4UK_07820 [Floccifex sp.]